MEEMGQPLTSSFWLRFTVINNRHFKHLKFTLFLFKPKSIISAMESIIHTNVLSSLVRLSQSHDGLCHFCVRCTFSNDKPFI